ncbi:MAG: peptide chain release factor N(5)-glutamine methyltransferase [Dehalococcoidia bacterium]
MPGPFAAQSPTGSEALRRGIVALRAAGIEDAALEAEVLLRHVLGRDRTYFYLHLPDQLEGAQDQAFRELLAQRAAHRPLAYITGRREFYGLDFSVQPGVLIPRPETELVVERCLAIARERIDQGRRVRFVDVGTGSGAIAIAFAKHLPTAEVIATDISPEALVIAGYNAKRLRVAGRVRFMQGDLLKPVTGTIDLIAANLPYVPTHVVLTLAPEVRDHEPRAALDGGSDGLQQVRRLLAQLVTRLATGGTAVLEIGHDQGAAVRRAALELCGVAAEIAKDQAGNDRVATVTC